MKSTKEQLENRGYVPEEKIKKFVDMSDKDISRFLGSYQACERTIGTRIATYKKDPRWLPLLCGLLASEKKLYTRIALSESIEKYGISSLKHLIPLLGKIGSNQHEKPALVDLKKRSFPLPRDIIARTIIRIGPGAFPFLEEILDSGTYVQKCEAIDAIGHIAYNVNDDRSEKPLHALLKENSDDELIVWKIIRAFQSFRSKKVMDKLNDFIANSGNKIMIAEAKRSLKQIERRLI